jgi:hypothetical protein
VNETLDSWTIFASSGEYQELAEDATSALAQFIARRPDDYVSAIANDLMTPRLVLEQEPDEEVIPGAARLERRALRPAPGVD